MDVPNWIEKIRFSAPITPTYGIKIKKWVSQKELLEGLLRIGVEKFISPIVP